MTTSEKQHTTALNGSFSKVEKRSLDEQSVIDNLIHHVGTLNEREAN